MLVQISALTVDTPILIVVPCDDEPDGCCKLPPPATLDTPISLQPRISPPGVDTPIELIEIPKPHLFEGENFGKDDDADGLIDEEKYNHIDDDGDGFFDEDVEFADNGPSIQWIILDQQDENHARIKTQVSDPDGQGQ